MGSERVTPQQPNNSSSDRMNPNTNPMNNPSPVNRTNQEQLDVDSQSERVNPQQQPRNNSTTTSPMNSNPSSNPMNQGDSQNNNSQPPLIQPKSPTDSQPGFPNQ